VYIEMYMIAINYLRRCARQYGIAPCIRYGARVARAEFDAPSDRWTIRLADGAVWRARYLISATGLFRTPRYPAIAGLEQFAGPVIHTARWDHEYEFAGRRIGVIGTGASAPGWAASARQSRTTTSGRSIARTSGWSRTRSTASIRLAFSPVTASSTIWTQSCWGPGT
jgi:cation diffusion facilitator CzcD-associated flavoprotein CzcO